MFEFWLKNQMKGTSMMLPVTPDGYENSFGREIETVRATDKGDINVLGKQSPRVRVYPVSFQRMTIAFAGAAASAQIRQWTM